MECEDCKVEMIKVIDYDYQCKYCLEESNCINAATDQQMCTGDVYECPVCKIAILD